MAAGRAIDWPRFLWIVRRQRVEGLVNDALTRVKIALPAGVAAPLGEAARDIVRENLAFAAESLRLRRRFDEARVPLLFVKGVTLGMLAYGTLAVKKAWDIDMAVPPELVGQACDLLAASGYQRVVPGPQITDRQFQIWLQLSKESIWRHERSGLVVELHGALVDNPMLLPDVNARAPRQNVTISPGITLPTLQKDELFAYLCVHGATHAWSRLKWIADVAALVSGDDGGEVERLYRRSVALGAGRCSAQALLLCSQLLALPLPALLRRELAANPIHRRLVRIALGAMAGGDGVTELDDTVLGTIPIHVSHFLLGKGMGYMLAEARRKSRSPHDRATLPLPRGLHFLYPLLVVPSWLWRRVRGPAPG